MLNYDFSVGGDSPEHKNSSGLNVNNALNSKKSSKEDLDNMRMLMIPAESIKKKF